MERLKENKNLLSWWKWAAILIVPYVILMGFLVPLGQGITRISPAIIKSGEIQKVNISGYNTKFVDKNDLHAWLKHDDWHIESQDITVLSPQDATLTFILPSFMDSTLSNVDLALVMDTPDGPIVLPSAINMSNVKGIAPKDSKSDWSEEKLNVRAESNFNFPFRNVMGETIRNTYFHVPLWFGMVVLFGMAVFYSIRFLRKQHLADDFRAESLVMVGVLFGILGTVTGSIWAKYTWGSWWSFDVKQNMAAISLLIYGGYFLLRNSISDPDAKSRIGSIYNIFAFIIIIPLIFIIPRRFDSLHPGNGGNPALGTQDLDNTMRLVFYPAVIAYILIGLWIAQITYRIRLINNRLIENT